MAAGPAVVLLRNPAGVSAVSLQPAIEIGRALLRRAGVESEWRICTRGVWSSAPCATPAGALVLELLGPRQCTVLRSSSDVLGMALLPRDGSRPSYAGVFLEKAESMARESDASLAQILGHAMAHELGHLLLRTREHSETGLMRAHWSKSDLHKAARGRLDFASEQSWRLRSLLVVNSCPRPIE